MCICRLTVCGTCHLNCILGDIFGLDTLGMTFRHFVLFLDSVESRHKVVDAMVYKLPLYVCMCMKVYIHEYVHACA